MSSLFIFMNDNILESKRNIYSCKLCKTSIRRNPSELRGDLIFCSKSCSASYYNKSKIIIKPCKNCNEDFHPIRGNAGTYCSKTCQQEWQRKQIYLEIESGSYKSTYSGNMFLKKYLISKRREICEQCQSETWQRSKIPLTVHHIDGNASNNIPSNLQLLCWNCHAITENYGRKNKSSARIKRYGAL